jgi:hypothetical protein
MSESSLNKKNIETMDGLTCFQREIKSIPYGTLAACIFTMVPMIVCYSSSKDVIRHVELLGFNEKTGDDDDGFLDAWNRWFLIMSILSVVMVLLAGVVTTGPNRKYLFGMHKAKKDGVLTRIFKDFGALIIFVISTIVYATLVLVFVLSLGLLGVFIVTNMLEQTCAAPYATKVAFAEILNGVQIPLVREHGGNYSSNALYPQGGASYVKKIYIEDILQYCNCPAQDGVPYTAEQAVKMGDATIKVGDFCTGTYTMGAETLRGSGVIADPTETASSAREMWVASLFALW